MGSVAIMNQPMQHHTWNFYLRPRDTWKAMYEDCARAATSIEFEQYILENDALGRRFMELFISKAAAGVRVFLICDKFGSAALVDSELIQQLRVAGGKVHFYNPITKWDVLFPYRWFPRTHTKTLLIDSKIVYVGGVCIAERMYDWRDTHTRIEGPLIAQVRRVFDDIENRLLRKKKTPATLPTITQDGFGYLTNRPMQARHAIYEAVVKAINQAERYIYITSAFFIPHHRFMDLLRKARKRGVEVIILVPQTSDVILADWICLSYFWRLHKAGLRVFRYQKTVLHSKTIVIDDVWASVGSMNFDLISFFHNREANIIIREHEAVMELKQHFLEDLQNSEELTPAIWHAEPLVIKLIGYAARILKIFF